MDKYIDIYPNCFSQGIGLFSAISANQTVPWHEAYPEDVASLEMMFATANSQKSFISTFLVLTEENRVKVLLNMFGQKWKKLWDIYTVEYNMLDAYIVRETGNKSNKHGHVIGNESANTGTLTNTGSENSSGEEGIFGFNSSSSSGANTSRDTTTSNNTETRNLSNTGTTTHSGTDSEEYSVNKTGNIGYSTPQKMIREEFELWGEPFFKQVFNDIVSFAMIQVY